MNDIKKLESKIIVLSIKLKTIKDPKKYYPLFNTIKNLNSELTNLKQKNNWYNFLAQ